MKHQRYHPKIYDDERLSVKRKRGWDCHGLPVEKAVEKALGIDGKKDIEEKI